MNVGEAMGGTGVVLAVLLLGWAISGPRPAPIIAPAAFVLPIAPALCLTTTSGPQQVVGASGLALAFSALVALVLRLDREAGADEVHVRWQEFERAFRRHVDGSADRPGERPDRPNSALSRTHRTHMEERVLPRCCHGRAVLAFPGPA